jgi:hypothetical protein
MSPLIDVNNDKPDLVAQVNASLSYYGSLENRTFANSVYSRYEMFLKSKHIKMQGTTTGHTFELIIADSMMKYGVDQNRFFFHAKSDTKNTDIDLLILPKIGYYKSFALMMKTSLRERWKQEDRDALMIHYNSNNCWSDIALQFGLRKDISPDIWALTFKEKKEVTPQEAIDHAARIGSLAGGIQTDKFISVYDEEGMNRLLEEIS